MDHSIEQREKVLDMGEDEIPVSQIVKATGVTRNTVIRWLESEGVEPSLERGRTRRKGSLRNTPLALSIEEGVRRRLEGQERGHRGK